MNLVTVKTIQGKGIGIVNYIFTYGLVSGYDPYDQNFFDYEHRFCYPKERFSESAILAFAINWDGKSMPPDGWVKYKGLIESSPEEKDKVEELFKE